MWVYFESERSAEHVLYTVGFYKPDGTWEPESDHSSRDEAAARVHYLNGGKPEPMPTPELRKYVREIVEHGDRWTMLHTRVFDALRKAGI